MTTTQTDHQLPLADEGETTAGNYFVANYPPFSFWTPEHVPEAEAALDHPPAPGTDLGLYIHIPFCRKRCHFCYFKVYTDRNNQEILGYLDAVKSELALLIDRRFIDGRKPSFIYFGGGTPSYLSAAQLQRLTDGLKQLLPWDTAKEIAFEAEPGTLNASKIQALKEIGVTRLSLGVENFDEQILRINGRAHGTAEIDKAYATIQATGFQQVNIDLIAGMVNETEENWADCIRKTVALAPDSVTIYQMEVPYNTTIYKQMKTEGKLTAPVADWKTKRRWVAEAFAELERAGYSVTSAYTAVRDTARTKFLYRDRLWTGADLIGLGVASFSQVGGAHFQNQHDIESYQAALAQGGLPIYRAMTMRPEEQLIRELILQLKLGKVSPRYFQTKFGVDIAERFTQPLATLRQAGMLTMDAQQITLTRDALLQVDRLLHEFFLPEHRTARYA